MDERGCTKERGIDMLGILESLTPILLPLLTAVVGGMGTYLTIKINAKKDITISDRMQLSKDQYQLIAELRDMMQEQKEETESLRNEIRQLQVVNANLTLENSKLQAKIDTLNFRLDSRIK